MEDQLDLFTWAESRPAAVILDARPRLERRVSDYCLKLYHTKFIPTEAEIVPLRRDRGAA